MVRSGTTGTTAARIAALLLVVLALVATATPAHAATTRTISGTVVCANSNPVVGIWVDSSGGGSRWVESWTPFAGKPNAAYYTVKITTSGSSTSIKLQVGCGGKPAKWWSDNGTPRTTVTGSTTLNARCWEAAGKADRCKWPTRGKTTSTNTADAGYCTWGALEKWKDAFGYYPLRSGNASSWDNTAAANGWYVSTVPHVNSIVVFEAYAGGSGAVGHVAWVTRVTSVGGGAFDIGVTEMNANHNGGGFKKYNTYTYRHVNGQMSYIVAAK